MATRLPVPGQDDGTWGDLLNSYLLVSHDGSGDLLAPAIERAGGVTSVNGETPVNGAVTLSSSDIGPGDANSLQGTAVDGSAPNDGQALIYNATAGTWGPATVTSSGTVSDATPSSKGIVQLAGDLGGTASAPTVAKVNGVAVTGTPASSGQVLTSTSTTAASWSAPASAPVTSVAGKTGVVTLTSSDVSGVLAASNNLSDVASVSTARTNLGLGTAATQPTSAFDAAGAATTAQGASLQKTSNLSDLASAATARTNLGLGTAATISSTAGGDLSGTLPNPTVAKVNGVAVTGTPASSGQVLTSTSTTAASWSAPAAGFADPTTTKGDLIVHGASTTRLPVGTNGQVLTADSTQANGIKWAPTTSGTFTAVAKAASYTASNYDFVVCNAATAGFTVTLPPATNGATVRIKKTDATVNAIVVVGQSGATIDGGASAAVNAQWQSQDFASDGTNWYFV